MGKYVLVYKGGAMAESEAAQQEAMTQWMNWFATLGQAIVDAGAPFGTSSTVGGDGAVSDGAGSALTGYSIIEAADMAAAAAAAKGCPVLSGGGEIEIYEAMPMG